MMTYLVQICLAVYGFMIGNYYKYKCMTKYEDCAKNNQDTCPLVKGCKWYAGVFNWTIFKSVGDHCMTIDINCTYNIKIHCNFVHC